MKKKATIYAIITFALFLGVWEGLVRFFAIPVYILPSPTRTLMTLSSEAGVLWMHTKTTLTEALLGLVIATLLAFFIAILMDRFKGVKLAFYPHLVISQTVPIMVLGPLFSIWFGFGLLPKVLMVILMCTFPMIIAFSDALSAIDSNKINLLRSYQASEWQVYSFIKIPEAIGGLFSGMKVAATYCVGGAIVGEWLSASSGLGYYMIRAKNGFQLDKVFASVLIVVLLSLMLNALASGLNYVIYRGRMK